MFSFGAPANTFLCVGARDAPSSESASPSSLGEMHEIGKVSGLCSKVDVIPNKLIVDRSTPGEF